MSPSDDACDALFEEARQYLDDERFAEAVDAFTDFLALVPESEGAYGNRGLAYLNLGDDEQAIRDFEMVLRLNDEDAMGYAMMAEAHRNLGRHEEALAAAAAALELDPEEPTALAVRGWLFAFAGQYAHAAEDLQAYADRIEDPGEALDLLDACRALARPEPRDEAGRPLPDPDAQEEYLARRGLSFDFSYNPDYEAMGLFCPYAHCVRNMPVRAADAWMACPFTGYECPGGEDQAAACDAEPFEG